VVWASRYPTAAVVFSGWNATCMMDEGAPLCGNAPNYMFVRQSYDFMCQPESTALYGVQHCFSRVTDLARGVDVIMGVAGPLYRRSMFGDDFFDVPKLLAEGKLKALVERTAAEEAQHDHAKKEGGGVTSADLEAGLAHVGALANEKLKRTPPPTSAFLVDDVTISAYLRHRGVPALVVPWQVPLAQLPNFPRPKRDFPEVAAPPVDHKERTDAIAALHGDPQFLNANAAAARYFRHLGWW
jgi:hypothetical protein